MKIVEVFPLAYFEHSLCDKSLKADEIKEHFREVTKMVWGSEGACYLCGVSFILKLIEL